MSTIQHPENFPSEKARQEYYKKLELQNSKQDEQNSNNLSNRMTSVIKNKRVLPNKKNVDNRTDAEKLKDKFLQMNTALKNCIILMNGDETNGRKLFEMADRDKHTLLNKYFPEVFENVKGKLGFYTVPQMADIIARTIHRGETTGGIDVSNLESTKALIDAVNNNGLLQIAGMRDVVQKLGSLYILFQNDGHIVGDILRRFNINPDKIEELVEDLADSINTKNRADIDNLINSLSRELDNYSASTADEIAEAIEDIEDNNIFGAGAEEPDDGGIFYDEEAKNAPEDRAENVYNDDEDVEDYGDTRYSGQVNDIINRIKGAYTRTSNINKKMILFFADYITAFEIYKNLPSAFLKTKHKNIFNKLMRIFNINKTGETASEYPMDSTEALNNQLLNYFENDLNGDLSELDELLDIGNELRSYGSLDIPDNILEEGDVNERYEVLKLAVTLAENRADARHFKNKIKDPFILENLNKIAQAIGIESNHTTYGQFKSIFKNHKDILRRMLDNFRNTVVAGDVEESREREQMGSEDINRSQLYEDFREYHNSLYGTPGNIDTSDPRELYKKIKGLKIFTDDNINALDDAMVMIYNPSTITDSEEDLVDAEFIIRKFHETITKGLMPEIDTWEELNDFVNGDGYYLVALPTLYESKDGDYIPDEMDNGDYATEEKSNMPSRPPPPPPPPPREISQPAPPPTKPPKPTQPKPPPTKPPLLSQVSSKDNKMPPPPHPNKIIPPPKPKETVKQPPIIPIVNGTIDFMQLATNFRGHPLFSRKIMEDLMEAFDVIDEYKIMDIPGNELKRIFDNVKGHIVDIHKIVTGEDINFNGWKDIEDFLDSDLGTYIRFLPTVFG